MSTKSLIITSIAADTLEVLHTFCKRMQTKEILILF